MNDRRGTDVLPVAPAEAHVVKCQCSELWAHPAAQLLFGEALRPGGVALTARLLDATSLPAGAAVLDVGCGPGATLALLRERGARAVGVDYSQELAAESSARAPVAAGDAERLPFAGASFDAALMECMVSTLPDKTTALAQVARVVRPGGWLVLTDVTVRGPFPEPLQSVLAWAACTAGALDTGGYVTLVERAAFDVHAVEDVTPALSQLVAKVRRRLGLFHGAALVGIVPDASQLAPLADLAHAILDQVDAAIAGGDLGYTALVGRART